MNSMSAPEHRLMMHQETTPMNRIAGWLIGAAFLVILMPGAAGPGRGELSAGGRDDVRPGTRVPRAGGLRGELCADLPLVRPGGVLRAEPERLSAAGRPGDQPGRSEGQGTGGCPRQPAPIAEATVSPLPRIRRPFPRVRSTGRARPWPRTTPRSRATRATAAATATARTAPATTRAITRVFPWAIDSPHESVPVDPRSLNADR